jgi:site-specific recombinase XerD
MKDTLKDFLQHLRRRDVSAHTLAAYDNDVATFLGHTARIRQTRVDALTPSDVDAFAIRAFLGELHKQRISASSSARKLSAIRTFVKFLRREDLIEDDPATLVASPKIPETIPAHLTVGEMSRLLEMPDSSMPLGRRDRAILELFYASGLRLSELVGLDMEDVNLSARMVRVLGKGRKERLVPFNGATADALRAWLKDRSLSGQRAEGRRSGGACGRPCSSTIAASACRREASIAWSAATSPSAARNSASARTPCGTRSRRTCSPTVPTCASSRNCCAMPA